MDVKIEKQENNTVKLDITVDAETASQEYSKTCKKVSESVNIPGFQETLLKNMSASEESKEKLSIECFQIFSPM